MLDDASIANSERLSRTDRDDECVVGCRVVGHGLSAVRFIQLPGWELKALVGRGDPEPRLHDAKLAERLGYYDCRGIREIVTRLLMEDWSETECEDRVLWRWGAEMATSGDVEFWLTRRQVFAILAHGQLGLDPGDPLWDELLLAFELARRIALAQRANFVAAPRPIDDDPEIEVWLEDEDPEADFERVQDLDDLYRVLEKRMRNELGNLYRTTFSGPVLEAGAVFAAA